MAGNLDLLSVYLSGQSEPCPACRYDLRDLRGRTCPECGERLRLAVGLVEPKLGTFLVGVVGLAVAVGFSGLGFLFVAIQVLAGRMRPSNLSLADPHILVVYVVLLFSSLSLFAWLRHYRRLRRKSDGVRWTYAVLCWVPALITLALESVLEL